MHDELNEQFDLAAEVILLLAALALAVIVFNSSINMNDKISERAIMKAGVKSEYELVPNQVVKGTKMKFIQFNTGIRIKASGILIKPDTSKSYLIRNVQADEVEVEVIKK